MTYSLSSRSYVSKDGEPDKLGRVGNSWPNSWHEGFSLTMVVDVAERGIARAVP
jgi:hypothetical protein